MKCIFSTILSALLTLSFSAQGMTVVVRSQDVKASKYDDYLLANQERVSYIQFYAGTKFKSLSDQSLDSAEKLLENPLTSQHREVLLSLYLRSLESNLPKYNRALIENRIDGLVAISPELGRNFGLKGESTLMNLHSDVSDLSRRLGYEHQIYVDGIPFEPKNKSKVLNTDHQWILVSNIYEPLLFYGRWPDFQKRISGLRPFVGKSCNPSSADEHRSPADWDEAYFSWGCVYKNPLSVALQQKQSILSGSLDEPKSSWLWPVVGIVGIAAVASLKGKAVIIKSPF